MSVLEFTKGKKPAPSNDSDDFQAFLSRSEKRQQLLISTLSQISQTLMTIHKDMCKNQHESSIQTNRMIELMSRISSPHSNNEAIMATPSKLRSSLSVRNPQKQVTKSKEEQKQKELSAETAPGRQTTRVYTQRKEQAATIIDLIDDRLVWSSQIKRWIGSSYQSILGQAFSMYRSDKLDITEVKVLASGRFLSHYHDFLRRSENSQRHHLDVYMQASKQTLGFYLNKYPKKESLIPIQRCWKEIDLLDDPMIGVVALTRSYFIYNTKENYYRPIKQFLNEVASLSSSHFNQFSSLTGTLYNGVGNFFIRPTFSSGMQLFSEAELKQNYLHIKDQEMFQVIMKWIEELEDTFQRPHKAIKRKFLNRSTNNTVKLDSSLASKFSRALSQCKSFKNHYLNIVQEGSSKIYEYIEREGKKFEFLSLTQVVCGLSSHLISQVIFDVAAHYLNKLIAAIQDCFIKACSQEQEDYIQLAEDLELITFTADDMLQAKWTQMEPQHLQEVWQKLETLENNGSIKIVRVQNRLKYNKKDIVINFKMTGCPLICKLKLQFVQSNMTEKEKRLTKFHSFISKLMKGKFGSIGCAASIYTFKSKLDRYFSDRLVSDRKSVRKDLIEQIICEDKGQLVIDGYKQFYESIFLCTSCLRVSSALSSSAPCFKSSYATICNQCVFSLLSPQQRVMYCLGKDYADFFQETHDLRPFMCAVEPQSTNELKFYSSQSIGKYHELWTESLIVRDKNSFKKSICFGMKQQIKFIKVSLDKAKKAYGTISLEEILLDIGLKTDLTAQMLFEPRKVIELAVVASKSPCSNLDAFVCAVHPSRPLLLLTDCYRSPATISAQAAKQSLTNLLLSLQKHESWDLSSNEIYEDVFKNINLNSVKKLTMENCGLADLPKIQTKVLQIIKIAYNSIEEFHLQKDHKQIKEIDASANRIRVLSVEEGAFFSMQVLNLSSNRLNSINFRELAKLQQLSELFLQNNLISDFQGLQNDFPNLKMLMLDQNRVSKLDFLHGKFYFLQSLSLNNNELQSIDMTDRQNLKFISINNNSSLIFLSFRGLKSLQSLSAAHCSIEALHLSELFSLKSLVISSNLLEGLDIKQLPSLKALDASDNKIKELVFGQSPLEQLKINYNYIAELDLSGLGCLPQLRLIEASFNLLQRIKCNAEATFQFLEFLDLRYNARVVPLSTPPLEFERMPKLCQCLVGFNSATFDYCWWCLRNAGAEPDTDDQSLRQQLKGYRAINKGNIPEKKRRSVMQRELAAGKPSKILDLLKFKDQAGLGGIFSDHFDKILRDRLCQ